MTHNKNMILKVILFFINTFQMLFNFALNTIKFLLPFVLAYYGFQIGDSILINYYRGQHILHQILSLIIPVILMMLSAFLGMLLSFDYLEKIQDVLTNRIDLIKNKIALRSNKKL
tara:strand:+ start:82 stop:426 length:345 start_codon:yes stop_codon:yes gene_type:complete